MACGTSSSICSPGLGTDETKAAQIVGRDEELARLQAYAQRAAAGQRQIIFVTGGAGIGKTALVGAFCRQIGSTLSAEIAYGQCVEGLGKKEEYYPVMEALGQLCASANGEKACRILSKMAPAWLPRPWHESKLEASVPALASVRLPGELR